LEKEREPEERVQFFLSRLAREGGVRQEEKVFHLFVFRCGGRGEKGKRKILSFSRGKGGGGGGVEEKRREDRGFVSSIGGEKKGSAFLSSLSPQQGRGGRGKGLKDRQKKKEEKSLMLISKKKKERRGGNTTIYRGNYSSGKIEGREALQPSSKHEERGAFCPRSEKGKRNIQSWKKKGGFGAYHHSMRRRNVPSSCPREKGKEKKKKWRGRGEEDYRLPPSLDRRENTSAPSLIRAGEGGEVRREG